MALFENECSFCKSKEHVSNDCPHNQGFIFGGETKCSHCGSIEHASTNCPHDRGFIFGGETKCSHCGSKDHASANCPHDRGFIFGGETKCSHCGSKNHASKNCPQNRASSSLNDLLGKLLGGALLIAGLLWLAFQVALPLIIINISIISLLAGIFYKRNWQPIMFPLSVLGSILMITDYNKGWFTKSLVENVSFFENLIPVFYYLNIATGLVALYFLVDTYFLKPNQNESQTLFKDKKRIITISSIVLFGISVILLQKFVFDKTNYQSVNSTESISKTPSVSTETSSQSNSQNIQPTINNSNYDDLCMNNIRKLIQAEDSRDFNSIYSYMSSGIERYWDAAYPSQEELLKRYTSVWNRLESCSNTINEIEKIDNNTFDLHNTFTYTGKKNRETKTINSVVRFKFDAKGNIIYINEVK